MKAKYINPYTDFGFKKLFGEEANKDLLIDFLNQLLPEKHQINDLEFRNTENFSDLEIERKAIFDIYCKTVNGERIVVEMQKAKFDFFKDRSIFYTTFPIREQAQKGNWSFEIDQIYFIAILDFFYDEDQDKAKLRRDVYLKDQDCEVFFEKLSYIFIQMPAFDKKESELESRYDKWLYFLKNLQSFDHIPSILKEPIFEKAFDVAEVSNYTQKEWEVYQMSLLDYWGVQAVVNTAQREGMEKGMKEGMAKGIREGLEKGMKEGIEQGMEKGTEKTVTTTIVNANKMGLSIEQIVQLTGQSAIEIEKIIKENM